MSGRRRTVSLNNNSSENIQVAVRCRPLTSSEQANYWTIGDSTIGSNDPRLKRQHEFRFDRVLYGSDNEALYSKSVENIINQAMEGYHATVFAYGQTASGKTYTMMGTESQPGVIPRSVDNVFKFIKNAVTKEFLLRISYIEIYNETIKDLLNPSNDNLKIHEDRIRGVYVTPLTEEVVTSPEDVFKIIRKGEANRHISATDYNLHSSRSHTIFQMIIESKERNSTSITMMNGRRRTLSTNRNGLTKEPIKISQLNLIDLAGSEKAASNEERRKEGAYINKSLLTLGTVISKLTENGKSAAHIPYRDSKLTRILQTSLSGLAKVAVICTISPSASAIEESINTLKFASRVKRITIHAKNDDIMDDKALLQKYRGEIAELKTKLQSTTEVLRKEKEMTQTMLAAERREHEEQLRQMRNVRTTLKERIDHLTRLILTSSSVVNINTLHDISATVENDLPISTNNEQTALSRISEDHRTITDLRQQLERVSLESKEKDKQIAHLQEELNKQLTVNKQLETALTLARAEIGITQGFPNDPSEMTTVLNQRYATVQTI
ncbi:hypothetical protein RMATCC62417_13123 [Rhizopus microsporus]|nr:hypothetical protein RMATCC62417_13123 [Rhizopus microsporus]